MAQLPGAGRGAPAGAFEVGGSPSLKQVLMLGAFVALGPLTIDLYLPGLPNIEADLGTTASAVQLTLTGTLIGLALGQLVVGPLSDALGRRRPLFFGTGVHVLASVLCFLAPSIAFLGAARVLQGAGARPPRWSPWPWCGTSTRVAPQPS
jgi:DHA1 family bicyclomycin/chloramphenicol resistance-like MFS transporter